MDIRQNTEDPIQIHDDLDFVSKQDVAPGETNKPAYTLRGPRNYVVGIEADTPIAPELRQANGEKLDPSTQIVLQKADVQGNPLGNAIILQHNLGAWNYEKMRSDPQYFKYTNKPLLLREREYLYVYLDIPSGSADFDASSSYLTIGDNVTQTGKPVYIRHERNMSEKEKDLVNNA
jgi:hypothetical protein